MRIFLCRKLYYIEEKGGKRMNWILDGVVAAVILGCAVAAWRKGLVRAVLGFLPMALALLGTKAVSPLIGRF